MLPLGFIEQFINRSLQYDPIAQAAIARLAGKKIRIRTTTPDLEFFAILGSDVVLLREIDEKVDLEIEGPSFGFIHQALAGDNSAPAAGPLRLMGDTQLAQDVMHLLRNLDIDWEEALAKRIGDVA
ncbi:MAG TPA: SCP2 sterol-binding domain-containing protein, partial [Pseudomonadales bacterium]|nr:SCP2 sterol-binding domain-containing protein [Pseudomonadales bacterium]